MQQQNPFSAFIQELFLRFSAKSPKFFVIWQWISGLVTAISGLPAFLTQLGVVLPPALMIFENKVVGAAAAAALFMSLMPAQGTITKTDASGAPLKTTDAEKLPFTAQTEQKSIGPKAAIIALLLMMTGIAGFSQSPFRSEPKLQQQETGSFRGAKVAVSLTDSIVNVYRFAVPVSPAGFTFNGTYQASAGIEYGLQHQDYNFKTQTYTVLWSANLVWMPINTATKITSFSDVQTFGALFGIKNNLIQVGPFCNPNAPVKKDKFGVWAVVAINLN